MKNYAWICEEIDREDVKKILLKHSPIVDYDKVTTEILDFMDERMKEVDDSLKRGVV